LLEGVETMHKMFPKINREKLLAMSREELWKFFETVQERFYREFNRLRLAGFEYQAFLLAEDWKKWSNEFDSILKEKAEELNEEIERERRQVEKEIIKSQIEDIEREIERKREVLESKRKTLTLTYTQQIEELSNEIYRFSELAINEASKAHKIKEEINYSMRKQIHLYETFEKICKMKPEEYIEWLKKSQNEIEGNLLKALNIHVEELEKAGREGIGCFQYLVAFGLSKELEREYNHMKRIERDLNRIKEKAKYHLKTVKSLKKRRKELEKQLEEAEKRFIEESKKTEIWQEIRELKRKKAELKEKLRELS